MTTNLSDDNNPVNLINILSVTANEKNDIIVNNNNNTVDDRIMIDNNDKINKIEKENKIAKKK